jgi:type IV secretion system protein TrbL
MSGRRKLFAILAAMVLWLALHPVLAAAQSLSPGGTTQNGSAAGAGATAPPSSSGTGSGDGGWDGVVTTGGYADGGALNSLVAKFRSAVDPMATKAQTAASTLFGALVGLELSWFLVLAIAKRSELADILMSTAFKATSLGFMAYVFTNSNTGLGWIHWIIDGFTGLGQDMTGTALTPSDVLQDGIDIEGQLLNFKFAVHTIAGVPVPTDVVMSIVPALIVVGCVVAVTIAYAVIAGTLLVFQVEAAILIPIVVFMTAFIGSRWTLPWAQGAISYVVNVGVRLITLGIVLALGQQLVLDGIQAMIDTGPPGSVLPAPAYLSIAAVALVFLCASLWIPRAAASAISGNPSMTLGGWVNTGGAALVAGGRSVVTTGLSAASASAGAPAGGIGALAAGAGIIGASRIPGIAETARRATPMLRTMRAQAVQGADQLRQGIHGRQWDNAASRYVSADRHEGVLNQVRRVPPPRMPDDHAPGGGAGIVIRHHDT